MLVLPLLLASLAMCQCNIGLKQRTRAFSMELMNHTAQDTQWHEVKSPLGIWSLLTSVSIGATGKTREQLLHILNLPTKKKSLVNKYGKFIKSVISPTAPGVQMKCNNFLFLDTGFTADREFEQSITNDFGAKVTRMNFKSSSEAAESANSVIHKTDLSITSVFKPDDFDDARMILTNTISFIGDWQFPFNASETRVQDFHDEAENVIGKVNMMQQQGTFQYCNFKKLSASVLELPYGTTNKYSFLALLPDVNVSVSHVYNSMGSHTLTEILDQMKADTEEYGLVDVFVNLPRFEISTNVILNTPLMEMGLVDMFDPLKARFNKISRTEKLYVSAIVHKAEIKVTETGTTASASTSAILSDRSLPIIFDASRPFLYFIIEKSTSTIIFNGAYSKPTLY